ncbi:hypothetical protein TVVG_00037 [Tetraselmis viridis virus SI1]|uniref:hypothetical protein n=1 Tax=Tetraselmis viridis virus S20 TaxID=754070 RepID=UPI0002C1517E|nr:hypothetical protein TVGG_00003 [Tetraselmis viridis virus S20]AGH31331.1 hypothetical protein TVGG_00003 [Tetraselmis viridis virus S20]AGH31420.1 hypothetical protein TVVG_00037 [Tetraselmis viridis virus SI1]
MRTLTQTLSSDRCVCQVIGCTRYTRRAPTSWEYICPTHWRALPPRMKRRHSHIKRLGKRRGLYSYQQGWSYPSPLQRMEYRQWRAMVTWLDTQATGVDMSGALQHIDSQEAGDDR